MVKRDDDGWGGAPYRGRPRNHVIVAAPRMRRNGERVAAVATTKRTERLLALKKKHVFEHWK
jgi:hypothetical protein